MSVPFTIRNDSRYFLRDVQPELKINKIITNRGGLLENISHTNYFPVQKRLERGESHTFFPQLGLQVSGEYTQVDFTISVRYKPFTLNRIGTFSRRFFVAFDEEGEARYLPTPVADSLKIFLPKEEVYNYFNPITKEYEDYVRPRQ